MKAFNKFFLSYFLDHHFRAHIPLLTIVEIFPRNPLNKLLNYFG